MPKTDAETFKRDLVWNVASLAVSGLCGIALNYTIGLVYDEAALGIFNQVFAAYIFFSQIAVLGIHHSALQRMASAEDADDRAATFSSAIVLTVLLGALMAAGFWLASPLLASLLSSEEVGHGMVYAAPGLIFFALDKVSFACVNGLSRMRWFAVLQASRFVVMLVGLGICVMVDAESSTLPIILTGAEIAAFAASMVALRDMWRRFRLTGLWQRCRDHLAFGIKGVMSGVLGDLHSRVDVLMLGYFTTDKVVGLYSFAAILAEGMFQLLVVLRSVYAPKCARLLARNQRAELLATIRRGRNRIYLVGIPLAGLAIVAYAYAVPVILSSSVIAESAPFFALLVAGMALSAGYMPFFQLLLYARMPGWHTVLVIGALFVNIVANAILIPAIGAVGAALATAIAFVASVGILLWMTRRLLALPM